MANIEYVDVRISKNWIRFIKWVAAVIPNGKVPIQFVNGQPTKLYGKPEPDVRFDKEIVAQVSDFEFTAEET